MAELQKSSSSVNSKEKNSLLDAEIGQDFLSSWKSMSVETDAMDFDFGTASKGKKKIFNFDNLDMDFNLDGEFDKISSFKVDMSDLDISSPLKKAAKERSKQEPDCGNRKGKQNCVNFSFDFNEIDSFSFEPSIMKEDNMHKRNQDSKGASKKNECQDSATHQIEGSASHPTEEASGKEDCPSLKLVASDSLNTSKVEILTEDHGDSDPMNESCPSNSVTNVISPLETATCGTLVASREAITLLEKTNTHSTHEKNQGIHRSDETISSEPFVLETIQDVSVQSVPKYESNQDVVLELQGEGCSLATKVSTKADVEENFNVKLITGLECNNENTMPDNLPQLTARSENNSERDGLGHNNHAPAVITIDTEPAKNSDFEITSNRSVSRESHDDKKSNRENQSSNSKLLSAPPSSGTSVEKLIPRKDKGSSVIGSKFYKQSDKTESLVQQLSKHTLFASTRLGKQQYPRRKVVDAQDVQSESESAHTFKSLSVVPNKGGPVQLGSGNNVGSQVKPYGPTEKTWQSTTQNFVNPGPQVPNTPSIKTLNKFCEEGNRISPLRVPCGTLDLSSLKISRNEVTSHYPSNSTFQKGIKSFCNAEKKMESQRKTASKMLHSAGRENQTSPTPSLKRKTFEALNDDILTLNPSKRLSGSPTESRNFREPLERAVNKQLHNHGSLEDHDSKNMFNNCQISSLDISPKMNMTELEITSDKETDGNVEKAEACTKELEDICNMLKRKHEEAKEILVRAIINNNNLLMLNHPIYEEKIRIVEKFAAQLMSKELHTST